MLLILLHTRTQEKEEDVQQRAFQEEEVQSQRTALLKSLQDTKTEHCRQVNEVP